MKCLCFLRWAKLKGPVSFTLFLLLVLCRSAYPTTAWMAAGELQGAGQSSTSVTQDTKASAQAQPDPVPSAPPRPFLRLIATLTAGLLITAARLAPNFRRFLGLGVFVNPYAFLFLLLGAGICGVPVASESTRLGTWLGPWITDLSGVIVTLILPAIRWKTGAAPNPVLDFEGTSTSNPLLAPFVNGICDRVLARVKVELVADSRHYTWEVIKLAASRVLEEETAIGRLTAERRDATIQALESFKASEDTRADTNNKYTALIRLLGSCSFSRLRAGLVAAAGETL